MVDRRMRWHGEFKSFMVKRLMRWVGQNNGHLVFSSGRLWVFQRRNGGGTVNVSGAEVVQRGGLDICDGCQGE